MKTELAERQGPKHSGSSLELRQQAERQAPAFRQQPGAAPAGEVGALDTPQGPRDPCRDAETEE